jgi:hypothetical protein
VRPPAWFPFSLMHPVIPHFFAAYSDSPFLCCTQKTLGEGPHLAWGPRDAWGRTRTLWEGGRGATPCMGLPGDAWGRTRTLWEAHQGSLGPPHGKGGKPSPSNFV